MKKTLIIATLLATFAAYAHDHSKCAMTARGDEVMGFSHETTKHTFTSTKEGGTIEARAVKAGDETSITAIRAHLQTIAKEFASGDFSKPNAIHAMMPPGAEVMALHRDSISYQYSDIENGGRVTITTKDRAALEAIHRFLRFQREEHGH